MQKEERWRSATQKEEEHGGTTDKEKSRRRERHHPTEGPRNVTFNSSWFDFVTNKKFQLSIPISFQTFFFTISPLRRPLKARSTPNTPTKFEPDQAPPQPRCHTQERRPCWVGVGRFLGVGSGLTSLGRGWPPFLVLGLALFLGLGLGV